MEVGMYCYGCHYVSSWNRMCKALCIVLDRSGSSMWDRFVEQFCVSCTQDTGPKPNTMVRAVAYNVKFFFPLNQIALVS